MKEKLLAGLRIVGKSFVSCLAFILTGFFTFLPLHVIGVPWWLMVALVIIAVTCKISQHYMNYIVQIFLFVAWVWSFIIVVREPVNALSIVYYIGATLYAFTTLIPGICRLFT